MWQLSFIALAAVVLTLPAFGQSGVAVESPSAPAAPPTLSPSPQTTVPAVTGPTATSPAAQDSASTPSAIWELIKNGLTVINLLLVWYLFTRTHGQQRNDREEDRRYREEERALAKAERAEQHKIEIGSFWIQRLILEPNREMIDVFFDKYEASLKYAYENAITVPDPTQPVDVAEARKTIRDFKTDYHSFRRRVVEPLCWVSGEFEPLKEIARQIEDLVSVELAVMPGALQGVQHEPAAARLATLRATMVRSILEAQSRFARVHQAT